MTGRSVLAALLLVPTLALASPPGLQAERQRGYSPEDRMERITEKLGLDEGQAAAIQAIVEASHEDGQQLREQGRSLMEDLRAARESGDEKALKSALKAVDAFRGDVQDLHESTTDAIRAELSLEQQALFVEMEMRRQQHHRSR